MKLHKTIIDVDSNEQHMLYTNSEREFGIGIQGYKDGSIVRFLPSELSISTSVQSFPVNTIEKWNQLDYVVFSFPSFKESIYGIYLEDKQTSLDFNVSINKPASNNPTEVIKTWSSTLVRKQSMDMKTYVTTTADDYFDEMPNALWYASGTDSDALDRTSIENFTHFEPFDTIPSTEDLMAGRVMMAMTNSYPNGLIPAKANGKFGWVSWSPVSTGEVGAKITESMFVNTAHLKQANASIQFIVVNGDDYSVYMRIAISKTVTIPAINKTIENAIKLSLISDGSESEINSINEVFGRGKGEIIIHAGTEKMNSDSTIEITKDNQLVKAYAIKDQYHSQSGINIGKGDNQIRLLVNDTTNTSSITIGSKEVATKEYVDGLIATIQQTLNGLTSGNT